MTVLIKQKPEHSPLKGIMLVLFAVTLFSSLDAAGKHLMTRYDVPFVAAVRYALNIGILLLLVAPSQGPALWRSQRRGLVVVRGFMLALATFFAGLALQRMPVGETIAIIYLQGFGVMLAAAWFLRERITVVGWICAIIGFAGVLLIARPGGALDPIGVVYAVVAAMVSVVYVLMSRSLSTTETTIAMLFHVAIVGTVFFALLVPFTWRPHDFTWLDVTLLTYIGVASLAGHFLHTSAYRYAPASLLAPFNYFHIGFAAFAGWLFYDHVPDTLALAGMGLIAGAGAALALFTHLQNSRGV